MRKANLVASSVAVASLSLMVITYALAFSTPDRTILVMVDNLHEGVFEFALILVALIVSAWHLSNEVNVCAKK